MRSNDVILGLPTDIAFFAILQSQMLSHLKANEGYSNLEMGTYTHIANSSHIYERHFDIANQMLTSKFEPLTIPKVNLNLISPTGLPTNQFIELFNNQSLKYQSPDNLYTWILTNINL
jgi:thymidylate synthase